MKYLLIVIIFFGLLFYLHKNTIENFVPFEALTNYKDIQALHRITKLVHNMMKEHNITYWICGGTLLGAIRDKTIIPWDDDVDLCIMDTSVDKIYDLKYELNNHNLEIVEWFGGLKIQDKNGITTKDNLKFPFVDLFIMVKKDNKIILKNQTAFNTWIKEYYYPNELYPLKLYAFEDYHLYGPNNPYNYLDNNFKNWKTTAMKTYNHMKEQSITRIDFNLDYDNTTKPYLWQYWDGNKPDYISLCMETVDKVCSKLFNIVRLNKNNIMKYLPEIKKLKLEKKLDTLIVAHKVDFYRIMLLYKYGGIYIDADIIVLKDPIEIIHKLQSHEVVGFGCTGNICNYGYGKPSNWILASRPTSILMSKVLQTLINKIKKQNTFDYHDLGKLVIWKEIDSLYKTNDYTYYHYPNKIDGSRDVDGNWITSEIAFSNKKIKYEDEENMLFFVIYNSETPINIKKMSRNELLSKKWNFTQFIKKVL
jgi:lipopolysaccharide cholinephosphotransferase